MILHFNRKIRFACPSYPKLYFKTPCANDTIFYETDTPHRGKCDPTTGPIQDFSDFYVISSNIISFKEEIGLIYSEHR